MSIIRAPRPQSNFYMLDKKISEDKRLSWAARGMLIFLLGKPDHWRVNIQALINETVDSCGPVGRDGVRRIIGDLIGAGYVVRTQARDGGTFGEVEYMICESFQPLTEFPSTEDAAPQTDFPATAEPATANPPLVSIEHSLSTERKQALSSGHPSGDRAPDLFGDVPKASPAKPKSTAVVRAAEPARSKSTPTAQPTGETWNAYATAYEGRYGIPPVRNAMINGQLANFVKRIGADEAPGVAAWYVSHNSRYYVQQGHSVPALVKDCEKLRTEWVTRRQVTATEASQVDRTQTNFNSFSGLIQAAKQREALAACGMNNA
jgi:hypothetical protein